MTGKTHKTIGMCTGVAFGFWNISAGNQIIAWPGEVRAPFPYGEYLPMLAVCVFATAAGAMLPDIDHDSTKIGSVRKGIITLLMLVYTGLFVYVCKLLLDRHLYGEVLFMLLVIAIPIYGLPVLAKSKLGRILPKISFKHRGIMHTLVVPLLLILWAANTPNELVALIIRATAIGYMSHLVMDCCTKSGCPVLWPVWPKHLSILPISTGSAWEYVLSVPLGVGIIVASALFVLLS